MAVIAIVSCALAVLFGLAAIVAMVADRPRRTGFEAAMRDAATYQPPRRRQR